MKIGYIQNSPIFGEKEKNFHNIQQFVEKKEANLLVLPELFATGYTFVSKEEAASLSEDTNGPTSQFLMELSNDTGAVIVAGFAEKDGDKVYNSALMVYKDKVISVYRKIHLYFEEKLWFSPGDKPFKVHKINGMNIGMMICFDWIFPESVRSLALLGADIITHSANLVLPYCQNAMITRCLGNRVYAITANRIGTEKRGDDEFSFTGKSQITSYNGDILSSAPDDAPFIDIVEVDIEKARDKSLNQFNNLFEDRRPNFYNL